MTQAKAQTMQQRFGFQDKELSTPQHDEIMLWLDGWAETNLSKILKWERVFVYRWKEDNFRSDDEIETNCSLDTPISAWIMFQSADIIEPTPLENPYKLPELFLRQWAPKPVRYVNVLKTVSEGRCLPGEIGVDLPDFPQIKPTEKKWECPITDRTYTIGFADMRVSYKSPVLVFHRELKKFQIDSDSEQRDVYFEVKPSIPSLGELIRQIRMYQTYTGKCKWFVVSPDTRFKAQLLAQGIGFVEVT